ncbi:MAG: polysaccharide deacetylase family protein [Clostridia bacterium]|nr:polysaccharide deacetylase family protein [Clostridia bacterium]
MDGFKRQLRLTLILSVVLVATLIVGFRLRAIRISNSSSNPVSGTRQNIFSSVAVTPLPDSTEPAKDTYITPAPTSLVANLSNAQQVTLSSVSGNASARAKTLVESNKQRSAEIINHIYTIQKGIILTFQGLGTQQELRNVLNVLTETGSTGTFFVSFEDLANNADLVSYVASAGHAVGLAVNTGRFLTTEDLLSAIFEAENTLRTKIGFSGRVCLRQLTGSPSTMLRQAAAAGGYTVLSQSRSVVTDASVALGTARQICNSIIGKDIIGRGEILHFELGRTTSDLLVANVIRLIMNSYTTLPALGVNDMMTNTQYVFQYPVDPSAVLSTVKGKIRPGQLTGDTMAVIERRYIGIDWMKTKGYLPGFTDAEIKLLDRTGVIKNDRDMVFLTFDGWGSDDRIEALLDVLKKHSIKATFFIRTADAAKNPGLLREIGLAGHTIGSNTHTGMSLATYKSSATFLDLTSSQVKALREDLVKSYDTLVNIVGDLSSGGRPVLSTLFRPHLLAASKSGLETVFGCGYTYSVSGYFTFEYAGIKSSANFVSTLNQKIKSGQIYIFHLDEMPEYMPGALDAYLTKMEGQRKQYRFVSLAEVL